MILKKEPSSLPKLSGFSSKGCKKTIANIEDSKQVIKASGSVGANYREANESLSKKRLFDENKNKQEGSKRKRLLAQVNLRIQ